MLESGDSVIHGNNGKPKQAAAAGRASLKAQAYEEIHRRINTLQFRPGDFLNEAYIAEMLELGRTPVREALSQLKHEGIVEIAPRKVKQAIVGYGAAQKEAVAKMVQTRLALPELPAPDAADALAIALTYAQSANSPIPDPSIKPV